MATSGQGFGWQLLIYVIITVVVAFLFSFWRRLKLTRRFYAPKWYVLWSLLPLNSSLSTFAVGVLLFSPPCHFFNPNSWIYIMQLYESEYDKTEAFTSKTPLWLDSKGTCFEVKNTLLFTPRDTYPFLCLYDLPPNKLEYKHFFIINRRLSVSVKTKFFAPLATTPPCTWRSFVWVVNFLRSSLSCVALFSCLYTSPPTMWIPWCTIKTTRKQAHTLTGSLLLPHLALQSTFFLSFFTLLLSKTSGNFI